MVMGQTPGIGAEGGQSLDIILEGVRVVRGQKHLIQVVVLAEIHAAFRRHLAVIGPHIPFARGQHQLGMQGDKLPPGGKMVGHIILGVVHKGAVQQVLCAELRRALQHPVFRPPSAPPWAAQSGKPTPPPLPAAGTPPRCTVPSRIFSGFLCTYLS